MSKKKKRPALYVPTQNLTEKEQKKKDYKEAANELREKAKAKKDSTPKEPIRTRLFTYFGGVRTETKKVVWPTKKETLSYTITVLVACAFFALFFWILDTTFLFGMKSLFNIDMAQAATDAADATGA